MNRIEVSRRGLLAGLSGLVVAFHLPGCAHAPPPADATLALGPSEHDAGAVPLNAWVHVAPDGTITVRFPAAEMGQGVVTALPMILAEELDADWARVRVETAPVDPAYFRGQVSVPGRVMLTGGSESVRGWGPILREAGAAARSLLVQAAAARWGVDAEACTTRAGVVRCGERSATYGELAAEAAGFDPRPRPKPREAWTLLGSSPPRNDIPGKVDGSALFGLDVRLPEMLVAVLRPCPHYGGRIAAMDDARARALPGVVDILVVDGHLVAVADTFWRARKAADAVEVTWDPGPWADLDDARIQALLDEGIARGGKPLARRGPRLGRVDVEATYRVPYLDHVTLEPLNATVHVQPDRCDVWAGTQFPSSVRRHAARLTGLRPEQVHVHVPFLGGGFGRRSAGDFTDLAIRTAMHFTRPVKLVYTREAQFALGTYRPPVAARMRAALDGGRLVALEVVLAGQNILRRFVPGPIADSRKGLVVLGEGLADMPYGVPALHVEVAPVELPLTVGWWRSVHGSHNAFFRECFLDEVAEAAGRDPVELRRELLSDHPRHRAVLDAALEQAGPVGPGLARGVAVFASFGSIVAEVADLEVVEGEVRVRRVSAAVDCGPAVHPDTIRAQVAGALTMGISATLGEHLRVARAAAVPTNLDTYPLLHMAGAPEVAVRIVDSDGPTGGIGEVGLPPAMAAVVNGIHAATGRRIRSLPVGDQLRGPAGAPAAAG